MQVGVILGVCSCLLTQRLRVQVPLNHALFSYWLAGGRESKACEEMEKKGFDQQPEQAQKSTINHSFQILGDDGQNSWLNINLKLN